MHKMYGDLGLIQDPIGAQIELRFLQDFWIYSLSRARHRNRRQPPFLSVRCRVLALDHRKAGPP